MATTWIRTLLIGLVFFLVASETHAGYPLVVWHGIGGFRDDPIVTQVTNIVKIHDPQVYVHSLGMGGEKTILVGVVRVKLPYRIFDKFRSFFQNVNTQVATACRLIRADPRLKNGYNAIGISQGGLFLRAVAQRCPNPPMKTLISFASPHQGIFGLPLCPPVAGPCNVIRHVLSLFAYSSHNQHRGPAPAYYWHDPRREDVYRRNSTFLADINQERAINLDYKTNLMKLTRFVLIKNTNDGVLVPNESAWFGFYKPGSTTETQALEETELWTKDKLGLAEMYRLQQLIFLEQRATHVQIDQQWFLREVVKRYL